METYSMSQVELLTGISAHKLRIWERRYTFLKPYRTPTNIRYYSGHQLKKLLHVAILNRNGIRISVIDKMSDEEINEKVTNILTHVSSDHQDEINTMILTMMNYDESGFHALFQRCIIRNGFLNTITDIIYPFLNQIGILWGSSKIIPAQEHFISNLIRQKIIAAIDSLPVQTNDAPVITLLLVGKEDHEIGLLLAAFIAKSMGWRVLYLGQRVPLKDIEISMEQTLPKAFLTHFITPIDGETQNSIKHILRQSKVPWLISGNHDVVSFYESLENVTIARSPSDLKAFLNSNG